MHIKSSLIKREYFWLCILACIPISGCDNTFEPLDKETGVYAIYGALDLDEGRNYIRVRDLNAPFTAEATWELDAGVVFENLETGVKTTLESERKEYDGVYLHNFVVDQEILPNTNYRLTSTRSDGIEVSVSTLTPSRPVLSASPTEANCYQPITVTFSSTNGGKIVYTLHFELEEIKFKTPIVLKEKDDNPGSISFTFTPIDELRTYRASCFEMKGTNFDLYYTYYSEDLYQYEEIPTMRDPFNIFQSTQVLGAFFRAPPFSIPIDTSKVCPQECQ